MPAKVGVLIPVWNGADTLDACLNSLACQTLADFEALVVDDGSTDATPEILADRSSRDSRFRVLTRPHLGLVPALNAGLQALETPLIARLDADDIALPERLGKQRDWLNNPRTMRFLRAGTRFGPTNHQAGKCGVSGLAEQPHHERGHPAQYLRRKPSCPPDGDVSADAVLKLGGYRDTGWVEDYDLWLRMAQAGDRFANCRRFWSRSVSIRAA